MAKVKINGKEYDTDKLSDAAKQALVSVQLADQEISRLKVQLGLAQTAKNAYSKSLQELLAKE